MSYDWTEPDLRPKPTSITLEVADDEDSIRLWWHWAGLPKESIKRLADFAEKETNRILVAQLELKQ